MQRRGAILLALAAALTALAAALAHGALAQKPPSYSPYSSGVALTVLEPPEANPLAREIQVVTAAPCRLGAYVQDNEEPGRGIAQTYAARPTTRHSLRFVGLIAEHRYAVTIHLADRPDAVIARTAFDTPALPSWAPLPALVARDPDLDPARWFAFGGDQRALDGAEKSVVGLVDREGRLRQLTLIDPPPGDLDQEIEGMQVVDGRMFVTDRDDVLSVGPFGDAVLAPPVQLAAPYLVPSHHQGFRLSGQRYWTLFNRLGPGLECDRQTPTDGAVGDGVAELDADGNEIWRWTVFDHPDHFPPDEMNAWVCQYNPTFWGVGTFDWTHANNVAPCPDEDALLISFRHLSQIAKVDRHTGEVLWQLGEGRDFAWVGAEPEPLRWFSFQHDPHWIAPQRLLMFDNGNCRYSGNCGAGPWSRALELAIDEDGRAVKLAWEHRTPFSNARGDVERLPDGHTFINTGYLGLFYEVTPDHRELWAVAFPAALRMGWARSYAALWSYED